MPKIVWDGVGQRFYETGVDHGVLYLFDTLLGEYNGGVAWNGLTAVTETPGGGEATALYADNIKYLNMFSAEEFSATIEAYTYPDEFTECDGLASPEPGLLVAQQPRKMFGLCYRTLVGNDIENNNAGYKLHLLYGCTASPSEKSYATVNDSPEAITFSWEVATVPVPVAGHAPTSLIVIDSLVADSAKLAALEDVLYGATATAKLPMPDEIVAMFA